MDLLEFTALPTVANLEQPTSAAFLEGEDTIETYRRVATELDRRALDEAESRTWLVGVCRDRSTHPLGV